MITTTFRALRVADACAPSYKRLAKALGGITRYGHDTPITLVQVIDKNGLDDAEWLLTSGAAKIGKDDECRLRLYAADCAERALLREREAGREPDARSWAAVEAARKYARGEIDAAALAAAWAAARDTARDTVRAAVRDAAWANSYDAAMAATMSAARDAAWDTVWTTFCDAAMSAARNAAWDAERAWQAAHLREMFAEVKEVVA